jgi:alpha-glucosidase
MWWREAVCYEVYLRSFADADGDGVGDLAGLHDRLPYLESLWITPFYPSPQVDHGYDVSDYCDVDPLFGDLAGFERLVSAAHAKGLRIIVDLVPNHTSDQHPWFQRALEAGPGAPERDRYLFRPGDRPFNNWRSRFGGSAWTQVSDPSTGSGQGGEWYLHLFDPTQPDLNWRHPDVPPMFLEVLRFWLDRGVDGFRADVAHGLFKEEGLPDQRGEQPPDYENPLVVHRLEHEPMWDQPEVHEVYRAWRELLESYDGDRMAVAEAWTRDEESLAHYIQPDELHQAFNFHWLAAPWSASAFAAVIDDTFAAVAPVGGSPTWVLANHDVVRPPTRYGGGAVGRARARAATLTMLALPGSAYVYQGEELGLEQVDVPKEGLRDPRALLLGTPSRGGCRVPLPWAGTEPPYDFGPGAGQPWLPQPDDWAGLTVEAQEADPASTLSFYRAALRARRLYAVPAGEAVDASVDGDVLTVVRGPLTVVLNCGTDAVPLPTGAVVLASGQLHGVLPPDAAAWVITTS